MTESENQRRKAIRSVARDCLDKNQLLRALEVLSALAPVQETRTDIHREYNEELISRRTRFFIRYAKEYSVRFSALLLLVVAHTARKFTSGKRGKAAQWHKPAEWYAHQLDIDRRQYFRLLDQARKEGFLLTARTPRGVSVWVKKLSLYTEFFDDRKTTDEGKRTLGFYFQRRARVLGLNGSMIYGLLKEPDEEDEYRKVHPLRVTKALPWLSERDARFHLEQLWQRGAIQREKSTFQAAAGRIGYRYYWQPRKQEDRMKWRAFNNCIQSNNVVPVSFAENVTSTQKMSHRRR